MVRYQKVKETPSSDGCLAVEAQVGGRCAARLRSFRKRCKHDNTSRVTNHQEVFRSSSSTKLATEVTHYYPESTDPAEHKNWNSALAVIVIPCVPSPDARTQVAEKLSPFDVFHDEVELRVVQKVAKPKKVVFESCQITWIALGPDLGHTSKCLYCLDPGKEKKTWWHAICCALCCAMCCATFARQEWRVVRF